MLAMGCASAAVGGASEVSAQSETYGYDALGRLITVNRSDGTSATYSYDPAGNRSQVVMGAPTSSVTPAAFDLGGPVTAAAGAWAASSTPTITGITVAVPVSITGGQYRINGGAWTTANGTISAGQTVQVQVQAPSAPGSSQTATLTVGGVSDTFQVSVQSDIDPDALTFGDITIHSNEPDVWGGTDSLITGINQPIVLRIERYGYNGNLDAAYIDYQVFDTGGAMVDSGYFDVRGTDPNDWRYRDVTVQNGYRVKYFAHVATNSGTQSAGWNVTVWNKTKGDAGTPTVLSQKTVSVTVDADNNHNVDDYTPDAFNDFVDQNAATNDPTIWFGPAQTVTGINKPITLRVQRYNYSGDIHDIGVHVYRDSGSGWIHQGTFDPRGGGDQYVDVTVNNGDKIHYAVDARTNEGRRTGTMNMVVFNLSQPGGAVQLSNRSVNVTVDADNNHNVADYTLDPISWPSIAESSSSTNFVTGGEGRTLGGINRNVNIRGTITNLSGNLSAGSRLEMWVNGALRYHSTNLGNGSWPGGEFAPGENVQFVARAVSADGAQRSGSYKVTVQNMTTGQALGSFTVNQTAAAPDYTPDAFNDFVDQNAVTNDREIWFGPAQTVTGINKPITLRVERYGYSGNFDEIGVHVYRDSGGGWIHQGSFDPRNGGYQYVDMTVNNGDKIHYAVHAITNEGRRTGTMNMVVWNLSQPGGSAQVSNRTANLTVDNDNNYPLRNIAPVDWDNGHFETNDNIGAGATGYRTIAGIEAPVTIRADILNITGQGYNLADGGDFYIVSATRGNLASIPWRNGGSVSAVVQPGEQIRFYTDAVTLQGRKQFGFDVQVYNATTGAHLDHHYQSGILDADNNWNMGGGVTLGNATLQAYVTVVRRGRPVTAQDSTTFTVAGGSGSWTSAVEFQGVVGGNPVTSISGNTVSLKITSSTTRYSGGQFRIKITDGNGAVSYSPWGNFSLEIEGGDY